MLLSQEWNGCFQYIVLGQSEAPQKYSDADVVKMLEYLIDSIFVEFGGQTFQQTIGIAIGTSCALLLAYLCLYSFGAEFIQGLMKAGKNHLDQQFNFTYRYINDVLSLNISKFSEYLEVIYPRQLEIKEIFKTIASSSYLYLYLYIDNGKVITRLHDIRNDFIFPIVNFSFLSIILLLHQHTDFYSPQSIRYLDPSLGIRILSNHHENMPI